MKRIKHASVRIKRAFLFAVAILLAVGVWPSPSRASAADVPPAAPEKTEATACAHVPGAPVSENVLNPVGHRPGSCDSVTYCELCGKELQREHKEYGVCRPNHLPDHMLKRTVSADPKGGTVVTFEDAAYPPLFKNTALPAAYDGVTLAKDQFLAGDGSRRTCADGETVCVICGEVLEEAIPHTWDRSKLAKPAGGSLSERITYSCLVCGETFSAST
ncbi:MAG: hypothetical protein IJK98_06650, partial [Clostridia bacterium]|nr:hypothetical protein [Clostridia bacterium]